jgi:diadenosine tetraphosphate (Ap4A) HIT family hydrolase
VSGGCLLCDADGGRAIARTAELRIVEAAEPEFAAYPGYLRIIWNEHLPEFTDLPLDARARLMETVALAESAMRRTMAPDKVNLASLGNMVPHLHWHLIPRYRNDPHFPGPIWAERRREADPAELAARRELARQLVAAVREAMAGR